MSKIRVGIVNYLNSRPLARGFLQGYYAELFEPICHPPARVAKLLASGDLEVGLIPSIEVQRIPGVQVIDGLCVAATHEVRSVLLVTRTPISEVKRVALDENSRTSAALVQILLEERYGICPDCVSRPPEVERMLSDCQAALLIGDPALKAALAGYRVFDLAAEWRELTGYPFVFALWGVRGRVELPRLASYFHHSLKIGLDELDSLVAEAAAELGLDRESVRSYLTCNLRYRLGAEERAGLEIFFRRAAAHGLIEGPIPLTFWSEPAAQREGEGAGSGKEGLRAGGVACPPQANRLE